MDFQLDATADGRRFKFLNVIDEHSRLCLAILVGRRFKAKAPSNKAEYHRSHRDPIPAGREVKSIGKAL
jgi:hypothetical protein